MKNYQQKFPCSLCGRTHDLLSIIEHSKPDLLENIPLDEVEKRVFSDRFLYIVDKSIVFIQGKIIMEMLDDDFQLELLVWVRLDRPKHDFKNLKKEEYYKTMEGVLENELYLYPRTKGSKIKVTFHFNSKVAPPEVSIESTENNGFYEEWLWGFPKSRLIEFWEKVNHGI